MAFLTYEAIEKLLAFMKKNTATTLEAPLTREYLNIAKILGDHEENIETEKKMKASMRHQKKGLSSKETSQLSFLKLTQLNEKQIAALEEKQAHADELSDDISKAYQALAESIDTFLKIEQHLPTDENIPLPPKQFAQIEKSLHAVEAAAMAMQETLEAADDFLGEIPDKKIHEFYEILRDRHLEEANTDDEEKPMFSRSPSPPSSPLSSRSSNSSRSDSPMSDTSSDSDEPETPHR